MRRTAFALAWLTLPACAAEYVPRRSPRIAMMSGTRATYVRDGRMIDDGLFGGGLLEAVAGDPEAEELAGSYQGRRIASFVFAITGGLCLSIVPASDTFGLRDAGDTVAATSVCMAVFLVASGITAISAIPYQTSAVNLFNDHVDLRLSQPRPTP